MLILVLGGSLIQKQGKINNFDKSAKTEKKMICFPKGAPKAPKDNVITI